MRQTVCERKTGETAVRVEVDLDGGGASDVETGVPFFDHMLDQLARHSLIDLRVRAEGDLAIDDHHTVEDVGIVLGTALRDAVGDARGIRRYGHFLLAMDDALARVALDFSGRSHLVWNARFPAPRVGNFDTELVREFFAALAMRSGLTLHVATLDGFNTHHLIESVFKATGRSLRMAVEIDPRSPDTAPTTKGVLAASA